MKPLLTILAILVVSYFVITAFNFDCRRDLEICREAELENDINLKALNESCVPLDELSLEQQEAYLTQEIVNRMCQSADCFGECPFEVMKCELKDGKWELMEWKEIDKVVP